MLTQADLDIRLKFVGASEAAAVIGLDPYRTPYDIWALKTGRVESGAGGDAANLGNRLEPVVLDWAEEILGPLARNRRAIRDDLFLGATFDALTEAHEPVEAKTSGLLGNLSDDWGDPGTDQVPERIIVQAHVQMLLSESAVCHIPALLHRKGLVMYRVERDAELVGVLCDTIPHWWAAHVVADTPPDGCPTSAIAKRIKRVEGKTVSVSPDFAAVYATCCENLKAAEDEKEMAQSQILRALGDAEYAVFGSEQKWLTYRETKQDRFDVTAFKRDHPDLYVKYVRQTAYRSLRLANKPKVPKLLTTGG